MLDHLVESGELTCPATSVDCYEWRDSNELPDETNLVRFSPIATCEHLLRRDTFNMDMGVLHAQQGTDRRPRTLLHAAERLQVGN